MELFLILSREHETLPLAELESVLIAENIDYKLNTISTGIIQIKTSNHEVESILGKRLAYTHEINQLIICTDLSNIKQTFSRINWEDILGPNFAVRVKKINYSEPIDCQDLERSLGKIIKNKVKDKSSVKLEQPSSFIRVLVTDYIVLIGLRLVQIDKKHFFQLKPHKRPFFYPGSMSPKLARCMVNLAQIRSGDLLLDPFCGTGGILIEAGIIGAGLIGVDIDEKMVQGTIKNLEYCQIKDYQVFQADARNLKLKEKVKAVVTDPPYGISASTAGEVSEKIYQRFLESIADNMLENSRICMATPHYVNLKPFLKPKLKIVDRHEIRMHKSLTRIIYVLQKSK